MQPIALLSGAQVPHHVKRRHVALLIHRITVLGIPVTALFTHSSLATYPRTTLCFAIPTMSSAHFIPGGILHRPRAANVRPLCYAGRGGGGEYPASYLEMWKKAMDRDRESRILREITLPPSAVEIEEEKRKESLEKKSEMFEKILQVPTEERDRIQRLQVIDRAAAAISAARAIIKELPKKTSGDHADGATEAKQGMQNANSFLHQSRAKDHGTPGPDFWSWSPPQDRQSKSINDSTGLQQAKKSNSYPSNSLLEKEKYADVFLLPFESTFVENDHRPPLPPLQSLLEVEKLPTETPPSDLSTTADEEDELIMQFSRHASEAMEALGKSEISTHGVNLDGSKWWRETGTEQRPDGAVCKWTLIRGVSADEAVEWEDKYWEASDQFDYKELGSEKSGRDAAGNVWREYWKESMWQDLNSGLVHMEKSADKWGKNDYGGEWHEKWWEHYDASGQAEKWAHKWCSIDPNTPLEAGHAHVWHERWGEKYDGKGGSTKYTDKWAERSEGYGKWSKWGDKWDECFDSNGHGVKQGEKWWEGQNGERWNRTWGEQHNGSGWVHKYGESSCGEHWDTHVQQDTWYERHPHFGFWHCFQNSVQLRQVGKSNKA